MEFEQTYPAGPETAAFGCFFFFMMLIALGINIVMIVAFCKICAKAGYHWALGLLMLVPIGNIFLILYLAFSDWPILQLQKLNQTSTFSPPGSEPPPRESFRGL